MAFPVNHRTAGEDITPEVWNADIVDNLNTLFNQLRFDAQDQNAPRDALVIGTRRQRGQIKFVYASVVNNSLFIGTSSGVTVLSPPTRESVLQWTQANGVHWADESSNPASLAATADFVNIGLWS